MTRDEAWEELKLSTPVRDHGRPGTYDNIQNMGRFPFLHGTISALTSPILEASIAMLATAGQLLAKLLLELQLNE